MFAAACAHAMGIKEVIITEINQKKLEIAKTSGFVKEASILITLAKGSNFNFFSCINLITSSNSFLVKNRLPDK